jgi:prepilin signal peptidase PulO-like enzyme (type II secretory pathway)
MHYSAVARLLLNRGRCPACAAPDRRRPLAVEVGMAIVFGFLWGRYHHLTAELVAMSLYLSTFVVILVTDVEHRLILHVITFPAILLALLASVFTITPFSALIGAAAGFGIFYAIYLLGALIFGPGAMGFGDVTLSTFIGAAVGFPMVLVALLIGILAGGLVSVGMLLTGQRRLKSHLPYGPFLLIGATITLLWGEQIIAWYLQ